MNTEIQRIPASVLEKHLEHKVLDICKSMNLTVELVMPTKRLQSQSSLKDSSVTYLRMKKMTRKNRQLKFGRDSNITLFVSENLSPLTRDWHENLKS